MNCCLGKKIVQCLISGGCIAPAEVPSPRNTDTSVQTQQVTIQAHTTSTTSAYINTSSVPSAEQDTWQTSVSTTIETPSQAPISTPQNSPVDTCISTQDKPSEKQAPPANAPTPAKSPKSALSPVCPVPDSPAHSLITDALSSSMTLPEISLGKVYQEFTPNEPLPKNPQKETPIIIIDTDYFKAKSD